MNPMINATPTAPFRSGALLPQHPAPAPAPEQAPALDSPSVILSALIDQNAQLHAALINRATLRERMQQIALQQQQIDTLRASGSGAAELDRSQAALESDLRALRQAWAENGADGQFALPGEEGDLAQMDRLNFALDAAQRRATILTRLYDAVPATGVQGRQAAIDAGRGQLKQAIQDLPTSTSIDRQVAADTSSQLQSLLEDDDSHYDFYEEILKLLEGLEGDWLDRNKEILENYIGFFDKLSEVMKLFASAFNGFQGDGTQNMNFDELWVALEDLKNSDALNLGGDFKTQADAEAYLKELGLEGVVISGTGPFQLKIDSKLLDSLQGLFPLKDGVAPNPRPGQPGYDKGARNTAHTPAKVNAITLAKDTFMERFSHISKVMIEKNQRTLQLWDTLVKTLSGTIDAIAEADRVFASNLT